MNPIAQAVCGGLSWGAGWCFSAAHPGDGTVHRKGCVVRTLGAPGDLAPPGVPARWSFHIGLSARPSSPRAQLRADGFRIRFTWDGRECLAMGVLVEPGVLLGFTDAPLKPSLFSAEHGLHRAGDMEWLDSGDTHVALTILVQGTITRFCLTAGRWDHAHAAHCARLHLDADVEQLFDKGTRFRQQIAKQLTEVPAGAETIVTHAVESLLARIQPPGGPFPHPWCSTGKPGEESLDGDLVFGLISAWKLFDPHMAEQTLRTLFAFQRPDGALPVTLMADGFADFARAPLPMLAQAVRLLMDREAFVRYAIPHVRNYLAWALRHFEQEAASSSCDLGALLARELEAYEAMVRRLSPSASGEFQADVDRLEKNLGRHPFNEEPLLSSVPAANHILELELLRRSRAAPEDRKRRTFLWKTLLSNFDSFGRLRDGLSEAEPDTPKPGAQPSCRLSDAAAASLAVMLARPPAAERLPQEDEAPAPATSWLALHARSVISTAVALPVMAALIVIVVYLAKTSPPLSSLEVSLGMAMQYYREGRYEKAIALYEDLARKSDQTLRLEFSLANAYFRKGDLQRAESLYRAALNQPAPPPATFLNLGLALYRQGRVEEALAFYYKYLDKFGDQWPDHAERARTAIDLIRQQAPSATRFSGGS